MSGPGLNEKVAFLSRPDSYPNGVKCVEAKQTHMSWVFLTDTHAWKLKKPVQTAVLDFSTPEARRRNCGREVQLNRRLAEDVYLGTVPLTIDDNEKLRLDGRGEEIDWLVWMRRLPDDRMLDRMIARHTCTEDDIFKLISVLTAFYKNATRVPVTGTEYRIRLSGDLDKARKELVATDYGLRADLVESVISFQLQFLEDNARLFDSRVRSEHVVEAHGDLRPEHVCLELRRPVIIDCLEFNRTLRTLDVASELAFFALECDRLGAPEIGDLVLNKCSEETGDSPVPQLLAFYKAYHACIRAQIAIWHLKDAAVGDRANWIAKANQYLELIPRVNRAA
jgi:aminoglycoside phosphotransferase family enzyme